MKKKVLCTALAVTMLLTTTASATAKPWWLSKYRVTFDNELGIVGNVTLTFASDGGSFIRSITKRYGESISLESYIPTKYGYTFKGWFTDPRTGSCGKSHICKIPERTQYERNCRLPYRRKNTISIRKTCMEN
ncbi:MAG: InlB B-repeat-containing protein [Clostridia bacterium]|nr:InlB B-repeat-containing protein [Clostridia bacterium]